MDTSHIAKKTIIIHKIIDELDSEKSIIGSLEDLKERGIAEKKLLVGAIHPRLLSMKVVQKWLSDNVNKVELVSISDILKTREAQK